MAAKRKVRKIAKLTHEYVISHTDEVAITTSKEFGEQAEEIEFAVTLRFVDTAGRIWILDEVYRGYPELETE